MRHRVAFVGLLIAAALTVQTNPVDAQVVTARGRIDRLGPGGVYPAPRVRVTLFSPTMGPSSPAYTNIDGMYYFYNVPPGDYDLQILAPWGFRTSVRVRVFPRVSPPLVSDIAPIQIR